MLQEQMLQEQANLLYHHQQATMAQHVQQQQQQQQHLQQQHLQQQHLQQQQQQQQMQQQAQQMQSQQQQILIQEATKSASSLSASTSVPKSSHENVSSTTTTATTMMSPPPPILTPASTTSANNNVHINTIPNNNNNVNGTTATSSSVSPTSVEPASSIASSSTSPPPRSPPPSVQSPSQLPPQSQRAMNTMLLPTSNANSNVYPVSMATLPPMTTLSPHTGQQTVTTTQSMSPPLQQHAGVNVSSVLAMQNAENLETIESGLLVRLDNENRQFLHEGLIEVQAVQQGATVTSPSSINSRIRSMYGQIEKMQMEYGTAITELANVGYAANRLKLRLEAILTDLRGAVKIYSDIENDQQVSLISMGVKGVLYVCDATHIFS